MDAQLQEIMERMCRLGTLLPKEVDLDDTDQVTEVKMVLKEMEATQAAMWARIREINKK